MNNNETESENIGWAVRSQESPLYGQEHEVIGWETISHLTRMKEITVRVSDIRMHHYRIIAPVITAYIINGNQSFSIVSKLSNDYINKKLLFYFIYMA